MKPTIPHHYFKFVPLLVPKVRSHRKRCTIRASRKRVPKPGEIAVLECWEGAPYRSGVERIQTAVLIRVETVEITGEWTSEKKWLSITIGGKNLTPEAAEELALADGFESLSEFAEFFRDRLPFSGHFYEWDPTKTQP